MQARDSGMNALKNAVLRALLAGGLACLAFAGDAPREESRESRVARKLRTIVIPRLEFRQTDIRDVIEFLVRISRELDPEKEGVNIVLNLGSGAAQAAAPADPFARAGSVTNRVSGDPLITFSARHLSLQETLKVVADSAGLKYRVQGNVVMVVPVSAPDGPIVQRVYTVLPTFPEKVRQLQESREADR